MRRLSMGWALSFLIGLVAFMSACQQQPQPVQAPPDTRAADEATLRDLDTQWSKAAAAKDVEGFVSFVANDGSLLPPNAPIQAGKDAIRKWAAELMASPGFAVSWQPTKVEVSRGGDLGYTLGTYELTVNDPKGKPVTDHGKYVTVWGKQADSSWKVVADVFNSDLPAAGAAKH